MISMPFDVPSCPRFAIKSLIYGPGRPLRASKHSAVSSVTHAVPSWKYELNVFLLPQWRFLTCSAAARHLAIATSCVVPCTSGTIHQFLIPLEVSRLTVDSFGGDLTSAISSCQDGLHLFQFVGVSSDKDWLISDAVSDSNDLPKDAILSGLVLL
jgi:hypothetical protein